ncbi:MULTISPECIES: DUF29 domain-containing protein [Cyanophyceae]|uniref:DUF29 domain-containing protein n=1 Tax=Cyanophyceae TaxID=3028117 RepID=UPI001684DC2A|nr:DUF29 domain-containing protein [Trichocoleus sp. FACHB-69]MBD1933672.1 DUF29 domain-containing protein [Trichocoleus sp. FACHB-69]
MTSSLPTAANNLSTLYEQDYYLWLETTARLLQEGQLSVLDVANLLEEIEDMGRSEKRAVYSNLKILLIHLLKYSYQSEKRSSSWLASIVEHRQRLKKAFKESPSLQPYFTEIFNECYQDARELASAETGLEIERFPVETPFTPEETLDSDYLPD